MGAERKAGERVGSPAHRREPQWISLLGCDVARTADPDGLKEERRKSEAGYKPTPSLGHGSMI